jgi:hypothetical protein
MASTWDYEDWRPGNNWELGSDGIGILVRPTGNDPIMMTWNLDESGRPFAGDVVEHLSLDATPCARFSISREGGLASSA